MIAASPLRDAPPPAPLAWLARECAGWEGPPFAVRLWNGQQWSPSSLPPVFTIVIGTARLAAQIAVAPDLATLGDAFVAGRLDVEGDLLAAFGLADHLLARRSTSRSLLAPVRALVERVARGRESRPVRALVERVARVRESRERAHAGVNSHYELPHEFFHLFLDEQDVYSCAYYERANDPLGEAQRQKLEHVCRKLRLSPGHALLDLGCGWGAFAMHAARHHGARVLGITLSEKQAAIARERIAAAGLAERCTIEVRDFRDLDGEGRFDRIASVGAIEHVPLALQPTYFARCFALLKPDGLMLNHGITSVPSKPLAGGNRFIRRYIFPYHELVPVHATLAAAQATGFEVRDVESLREHYQLTLAAWHRRLEERASAARLIVGQRTVRAFRIYLAGLSHHFGSGELDLHQSLLARSDRGRSCLPLTRDDLYASDARSPALNRR